MNENKRVLFLMSRFLDGGIDTVLVEYLKWLAKNKPFHLTLGIAICLDEMEVFREKIPEQVSVTYFSRSRWLTSLYKRRVKKQISPVGKIADELFLAPIRKCLTRYHLRQLTAKNDVVVDFDCCFYSSLWHVQIRKLAFFHFSFKHVAQQDPRRLSRIGRRLNVYDKVILIAQGMKTEAVEMFPSMKEKFEVIYNPKDPAEMERLSLDQSETDERIHEDYIIAIERLTTPKDIPTLLDAYALLRHNYGRKEKLFIIGKGEEEAELRAKTRQLGIASEVEFLGFKANPLPWLRASKLLVHSSRFEGLGIVMIEGLLLDKPVVATDCPIGPREVLVNGEAGLLTPVGDAKAMAEAMQRVLTDEEFRQELLAKGRQRAQDFTFRTAGKQLEDLMFP